MGANVSQSVSNEMKQIVNNVTHLSPLTANEPKLITTLDFSKIIALSGANNWDKISGLSRNARQRTFFIFTTLNVPLTGIASIPSDSTIPVSGGYLPVNVDLSSQNAVAQSLITLTSEKYPDLVSHGDSISMGLQVGSTAPTSGSVKIYVTELI